MTPPSDGDNGSDLIYFCLIYGSPLGMSFPSEDDNNFLDDNGRVANLKFQYPYELTENWKFHKR